jgi:hypothetical protein
MTTTHAKKKRTIFFSATALLLAAGVAFALQLNAAAEGGNASQPVAVTSEPGSKTPAEPGGTPSDSPAEAPQPAAPASGSTAPEGTLSGMSAEALAEIEQPVSGAVALDERVAIGSKVEAHLGQLEAVDGEAAGVGEVSGPAIRFTVTIANRSGQDLPTNNTVVTANAGPEETPALQLSGPGATSLPATIAAGQEASASYVFLIPPELRNQIRIFVNYEASSPIAAFAGTAPGVKSP